MEKTEVLLLDRITGKVLVYSEVILKAYENEELTRDKQLEVAMFSAGEEYYRNVEIYKKIRNANDGETSKDAESKFLRAIVNGETSKVRYGKIDFNSRHFKHFGWGLWGLSALGMSSAKESIDKLNIDIYYKY